MSITDFPVKTDIALISITDLPVKIDKAVIEADVPLQYVNTRAK